MFYRKEARSINTSSLQSVIITYNNVCENHFDLSFTGFFLYKLRIVSLLSATFGYACGWASPSINLLTSDESPLPSGRITMEEASWISSSLSIGGLFGNIFYGFITNAFGRKSPLILIAIPTIVSIPIRTTHKELIRIEN